MNHIAITQVSAEKDLVHTELLVLKLEFKDHQLQTNRFKLRPHHIATRLDSVEKELVHTEHQML